MYDTNINTGSGVGAAFPGPRNGNAVFSNSATLPVSQDTIMNALLRDLDITMDMGRGLCQQQGMFLERVFGPTPETAGGLKSSDSMGLVGNVTEKIQIIHALLNLALSNQSRIDKIA